MFLFSLLELYFMCGVILRSVSRHIVLISLWLEIHQLRPDIPNNSDSSTPLAHQSSTYARLHYYSKYKSISVAVSCCPSNNESVKDFYDELNS